MSHVRQQIRDAAVVALTGLATTGSRVHASRMRPVGASGLPCLLVATDAEEIVGGVQARVARDLTITVRGLAQATANLDDTLDTIAAEVETAAHAAGTLGGLVPGGLSLARIDVELDDTLDKPVGAIALQYRALYFTAAGNPGVIA